MQRHRPTSTRCPSAFRSRSRSRTSRPEFRPPDDPRAHRGGEDAARGRAVRPTRSARADLSGVTVVLDAGHGGRDTGALGRRARGGGVRLRHRVPRRAPRPLGARAGASCRPSAATSRAPPRRPSGVGDSRSARVLTSPPYRDRGRGDRREPALVPRQLGLRRTWARTAGSRTGPCSSRCTRTRCTRRCAARWSTSRARSSSAGRYRKSGEPYDSRREVREAPTVSFSRKERIEAEGISRDLAEHIVAAFRAADLPLHAFEPIRRNVIRGGRRVGPGDPALQPDPGPRAGRGLQPEQPGGPPAAADAQLSREGGRGPRRRARRVLRAASTGESATSGSSWDSPARCGAVQPRYTSPVFF